MADAEEIVREMLNAPILFGLSAQGHIPTIERELSERGDSLETWARIGELIRWTPEAAESHYRALLKERGMAATKTPGEIFYGAYREKIINYLTRNGTTQSSVVVSEWEFLDETTKAWYEAGADAVAKEAVRFYLVHRKEMWESK